MKGDIGFPIPPMPMPVPAPYFGDDDHAFAGVDRGGLTRVPAEALDLCPYREECKTCPAAGEDDVCLPHERGLLCACYGCAEADDIADARKRLAEYLTDGPVAPNVARRAAGFGVNPKATQALRDGKPPLDLIEYDAEVEIAKAMLTGAIKYGRRNYAHPDTEILASTYGAAVRRHAGLILKGEEFDADSGLSHWAHIGANANVVLGAIAAGTYVDDLAPVVTKLSAVSNARHSGSGGCESCDGSHDGCLSANAPAQSCARKRF